MAYRVPRRTGFPIRLPAGAIVKKEDCCCLDCCPDPPDSLYITLTGTESLTFLFERDDTDIPEGCEQQWIRDVTSTCDYDCADDLWIRCCGGKYWLYVNEDDPIELTTVSCDPFELSATASFVICSESSAEYDINAIEGPCPTCCPERDLTSISLFATLEDVVALDGGCCDFSEVEDVPFELFYQLTPRVCETGVLPTSSYYWSGDSNPEVVTCDVFNNYFGVEFFCCSGEWQATVLLVEYTVINSITILSCDPLEILIDCTWTDTSMCPGFPHTYTFKVRITE